MEKKKLDCKHGQLARSCEICELERENAELRAQLDDANMEASGLAMALYKCHFKDKPDAVDFELCDSVAGIITQIDNMVTGVSQENAELRAQLAETEDALNAVINGGAKVRHNQTQADAEVLRCAEEEFAEHNFDEQDFCVCGLCCAVRAAKEARNNE